MVPNGSEREHLFFEILLRASCIHAQGSTPLVIEAHSADVIATLLELKAEVEKSSGIGIHLTITGASEAHLLAREIGSANVGVILSPVRPFPEFWEQRRM